MPVLKALQQQMMLIAAADKLLINKNKYVRCKEQKCAPIFG
jgi:hypothetical protein